MRQQNAVQVLQPPMVGQNAFSLLQYLDEIKEQRTGLSKASMGLDADATTKHNGYCGCCTNECCTR